MTRFILSQTDPGLEMAQSPVSVVKDFFAGLRKLQWDPRLHTWIPTFTPVYTCPVLTQYYIQRGEWQRIRFEVCRFLGLGWAPQCVAESRENLFRQAWDGGYNNFHSEVYFATTFIPFPSFYRCYGAIKIKVSFQEIICKHSIALAMCSCSFNRESSLIFLFFSPGKYINCCFLCQSTVMSSAIFLLYYTGGRRRKLLVTQWRYAAFIYMGEQ